MLKLFSGSAIVRSLGAAAQLLFTLVVARVCGQQEAGAFFLGFSVLMVTSTLARLGSELSGLRLVARLIEIRDLPALRAAVDSRIAMAGATAALCAVSLFGLSWAFADRTGTAPAVFQFIALCIPPVAIIGLLSEVLKGAQHAWIALTVQNIAIPGLGIIGVIVAGVMSAQVDARVAGAILCASSWLVALIAYVLWYRVLRETFGQGGTLSVTRKAIWKTLRESPSLLVVALTSVIMQWTGSVLLGFMASADEVAGYTVAMRISIAVSIVHSAAASVVGPQMSMAHAAGDYTKLRRIAHQTAVLISGITWPALLAMIVLAPECLAIFGEEYRGYADVLRILLVGQLVAAFIGHSGTVLVMAGYYKTARWTSLTAAFALAVLLALLVPSMGAVGAAIAMAMAVVVGHIAGLLSVRRQLGLWTVPLSLSDIRGRDQHLRPISRGRQVRHG